VPTSAAASPKLTRRLAIDGRCSERKIGEFGSLSDIAMLRKPMRGDQDGNLMIT